MPGPEYEFLLGRSESPSELQREFVVELNGILSRAGYQPQMQSENGGTYARRYSPGIFILLYIILFPVGLFLLLARPTETLTVKYVKNSEGGTNVTAIGTDQRLREFFSRLGGVDQPRAHSA